MVVWRVCAVRLEERAAEVKALSDALAAERSRSKDLEARLHGLQSVTQELEEVRKRYSELNLKAQSLRGELQGTVSQVNLLKASWDKEKSRADQLQEAVTAVRRELRDSELRVRHGGRGWGDWGLATPTLVRNIVTDTLTCL